MGDKQEKKLTKNFVYAAGVDQALEKPATKEEISKGKSTKVVELSYDEVES